MEIATPIGIVLGLGLIAGSIMINGSILAYWDLPSVLIVVGGTLSTALIAEKLENVLSAFKLAKNAFRNPPGDAAKTIARLVELSQIARREGLLALENQQIDDPFLAKAVRKLVDGLPPEELRESLTAELVALKSRHKRGQKLFRFMGSSAPAMGMVGTMIGLVQMLQSLDDPSSIGPAMAVALLTTMYGAIIAFVICNPLAEKLERWSDQEGANMVVVIEGSESLAKGLAAQVIREKLEARLPPKQRAQLASEEKAA